MKYPTLGNIPVSREWIDTFGGYNHNLHIGDGEFYEMTNLSSDGYPILSTRPKRSVYKDNREEGKIGPQGIIAKDALCYIENGSFIINEYRVPLGLSQETDSEGKTIPKNLISMGAYVIIMPDKKYINTADLNDYGDIDLRKEYTGATFSLGTRDGKIQYIPHKGTTPPEITGEMENGNKTAPKWLDTSTSPYTLKQYSVTTKTWTPVSPTYVHIHNTDLAEDFSVHDGVFIEGLKGIVGFENRTETVILAKNSTRIVVEGMINDITTQEENFTVSREMPEMDFVIESGNRLWGCRYGTANNGAVVNEIYASKLGDFKNWNCFMGISTDSYVASVGTDGQFTGAISHLGYPIFFKENCMHKVYGNFPSNYQIQATELRGVQKGCERSLAVVNGVLYYKSRSGICAYDGSLPVEISSALGDILYSDGVAGVLGNKYYISMKDTNNAYNLFVYDTLKRMWHREDSTEVLDFCNCRGDLYYIDCNGYGIKTIRGIVGTLENGKVKWSATTGIIGTDSPDKKYISRLDVRMKLEVGTRVRFFAEYDSSGYNEFLFAITGVNIESFSVPVKPRRCDHLRLHILGEGEAKIFSICKTVELGSDV